MTPRHQRRTASAARFDVQPSMQGWHMSNRTAMITFGGMAMMAASLVGYHSWAMAQPSTRGEVSQAIAKLEPACKPIVQARFRARLVDEGRPLTRSEVKDITKGIRDCDTIDQQIAGLREG